MDSLTDYQKYLNYPWSWIYVYRSCTKEFRNIFGSMYGPSILKTLGGLALKTHQSKGRIQDSKNI